MSDVVNSPAHYLQGKIEVIDFITDQKLNFCRGNVVKYTVRAGNKSADKKIEDLEKAAWYLQKEIECSVGSKPVVLSATVANGKLRVQRRFGDRWQYLNKIGQWITTPVGVAVNDDNLPDAGMISYTPPQARTSLAYNLQPEGIA